MSDEQCRSYMALAPISVVLSKSCSDAAPRAQLRPGCAGADGTTDKGHYLYLLYQGSPGAPGTGSECGSDNDAGPVLSGLQRRPAGICAPAAKGRESPFSA